MDGPWSPRQWRVFDPVVRAERRRRRARHSVGYRVLAALGLAWITSWVGVEPDLELGELFWGAATALTAVAAANAGRRLYRLEHSPRVVVPSRAPAPPPVGSGAHASITRLMAREAALAELLTVLGPAAGDAWPEASRAAIALRALADQVVVLESARGGVPPEAVPGLDAALGALHLRLSEGVSAYDLVVSAATEAVAAGAEGRGDDAAAVRRLSEAADGLAGLARGLREVRALS